MTELTWETLDQDAPWPETVHRATAGVGCEYRIAHYVPDRDKKSDNGPKDLWALSADPSNGEVSYHGSLDAAQSRASELEARITA